jgi:Fic-DOC domain mobile mystery protein B
MKFVYPKGATPLDPASVKGLIPGLTTQKELNEFENLNIGQAMLWAMGNRKIRKMLVTVDGIQMLHRKMFDQTWKWAGKFRLHDTNIGVPWQSVPVSVKQLVDDVGYWLEHGTYPIVDAAVRFHHKLVLIHPFPNGNGRLGRLAADLLLQFNGNPPLTWGRTSLTDYSQAREQYLDALHEADNNRYEKLLGFART